jgi:hypothetical protein
MARTAPPSHLGSLITQGAKWLTSRMMAGSAVALLDLARPLCFSLSATHSAPKSTAIMYSSSTLPLCLSAWVLAVALALDSHTVSARPVPAAAPAAITDHSVVLSPVQRSLPATTAPFLVSRKVRRSTATTPLRLVDDEPDVIQSLVVDMRDPRNWRDATFSSSTAAPVELAPSKRDRVPSMPMPDSIFTDLFSGPDSDSGDASSLEPNGIHASLAAAMAVRQIEQRQTPQTPQTRFTATRRPATTEADVEVPTLPASESGGIIDSVNRMNPAAAAVA